MTSVRVKMKETPVKVVKAVAVFPTLHWFRKNHQQIQVYSNI